MRRSSLTGYLEELRASGAVTAASAVIGNADEILGESGCGATRRRAGSRVTPSSLFDLASLTKPVVATLGLAMDSDRLVQLETPIGEAIEKASLAVEGATPELVDRTLASLLRHRSGLAPWTPLFARCRSADEAVPFLTTNVGLLGAAASTYSDLGYILFGRLAEAVSGIDLPELIRQRLTFPLQLEGLCGPPGRMPAVVECRLGNARERQLAATQGIELPIRRAPSLGTPQDGNARFLGPSGHAGLFGSARDLWRLAAEWARPGRLLTEAAVSRALGGDGEYALGWRRRPPATRNRSGVWYGHVGFTGGGVWFSPETREIRVLLAHRSSVRVRLEGWRERFLEIRP